MTRILYYILIGSILLSCINSKKIGESLIISNGFENDLQRLQDFVIQPRDQKLIIYHNNNELNTKFIGKFDQGGSIYFSKRDSLIMDSLNLEVELNLAVDAFVENSFVYVDGIVANSANPPVKAYRNSKELFVWFDKQRSSKELKSFFGEENYYKLGDKLYFCRAEGSLKR